MIERMKYIDVVQTCIKPFLSLIFTIDNWEFTWWVIRVDISLINSDSNRLTVFTLCKEIILLHNDVMYRLLMLHTLYNIVNRWCGIFMVYSLYKWYINWLDWLSDAGAFTPPSRIKLIRGYQKEATHNFLFFL